MPVDGRGDRGGELEREFVGDDAALAGMKEGATLEQVQVTVRRLRELCGRIDQRQLEPDDWALVKAVILEEMT